MADRGSTVYLEYVKEQVTEQDERKDSIEKRGLAVITSSGTIVSLLFALVAILTGVDKYELPNGAEPWLGIALGAFAISSLAGILTNAPLRYRSVEASELRKATRKFWGDSPDKAEKRVAVTEVEVLETAKSINTIKAWILVAAIGFQLLAVICLALAIRVILVHA